MFCAVEITPGDEQTIRCGHDEPDNIPTGISFETTMPGGFDTGQVTIPKPPDLRSDDKLLNADVRFYGPGGRTLYEGRVTAVTQVSIDEVQLQCAGWSSVLAEHQTFRQVFIDRDQGRWRDPSRQRRLDLLAFFNSAEGGGVETDSTTPTVTLTCETGLTNPWREMWYDAGPGVKVARIDYSMTSVSIATHLGAVGVATTSEAASPSATSDLLTGTNSSASGSFTPTTAKRWGFVNFGLFGTVGSKDTSMATNLAVVGDHGLTIHGSGANRGVLASDVIAYAVGRSMLNLGEIETTTFPIPHCVFSEDTPLQTVVEDVSKFGGNQLVANDWGVYDNREFFWQSPGTYGREWVAEDTTSVSDGPAADRRVGGIKIGYTDAAGEPKSVGPPGSNSDHETDQLLDSDTENPAHRIPGAWPVETVEVTSQQGAINIGVMLLRERNRLDWRGSIEVAGQVRDRAGNPYPAAMVRAGDRLVVNGETHTVSGTTYDHAQQQVRCDIGAKPERLETMLTRLGAVTEQIASE